MDYWKLGEFIVQNLVPITSFIGLVYVMFTNKNKDEVAKARAKALELAIEETKQLASQELGNKEKRQAAIDAVLNALPDKYKKHLDSAAIGGIVEIAWTQWVKPELDKPDAPAQ